MLTLRRDGRTGQSGITLIELLISMIILGIVSTMLIAGWINLQRASAFAVSTNNARATARDAMSRISSELRGAQPTSLPTATPSATATPTPQPPITSAGKWQVTFYSSFNSAAANSDGSGLTALRKTQIELDTGGSAAQKTLYWRKDTDGDDVFDRSIVLATNVVNTIVADATNGTSYTPVFRYAYRDIGGDVLWTDNADSSLVLASVVGVRVRLIIDANMAHSPNPVDITTTVRLRNASSD